MSGGLSLISGSAKDGVWQATVTIAQGAAAGSWGYDGSVNDGVNNLGYSNGLGAPQNLPVGAPGTLTVTDGHPPTTPTDISAPSISGSAQQEQTLTESHGSWSNSPTGYAYQWKDCDSSGNDWSAISGATGQTYMLAAADVGQTIRVQETASNAGGASGAVTSAPTGVVAPVPPTPVVPPVPPTPVVPPVPPTPVVPPAPPPGAVSSAHASSSSSDGAATATDNGTTVAAHGEGAVTVAQYGADPAGTPTFASTGGYFDVRVASGSSFSGLSLADCNLNGGKSLRWWNGSAWQSVSPDNYSAGPPACVTVFLGPRSSPRVTQLTGTVFAVASSPFKGAARAIVGPANVRATAASVPVSCRGSAAHTCKLKFSLTVIKTIKQGRVIAVTAAKKSLANTIAKKVVVLWRQDDHTQSRANQNRPGGAQPSRRPPTDKGPPPDRQAGRLRI